MKKTLTTINQSDATIQVMRKWCKHIRQGDTTNGSKIFWFNDKDQVIQACHWNYCPICGVKGPDNV